MKTFYAFSVLLGLLFTHVYSFGQDYTYYGEMMSKKKALSTKTFIGKISQKDSLRCKIEATIVETCQVKGCWMLLDLGDDQTMRVTFKDYSFFVPKSGVNGRKAIVEGKALKSTTDLATLRHYAKDAGKSNAEIAAIAEPKNELTFIATGVAIEKPDE